MGHSWLTCLAPISMLCYLLLPQAVNSKPRRGDDRPNVPDTWTYRIKNHLLFQPELEQVTTPLPCLSEPFFSIIQCVPSILSSRPLVI